MLKVCKNKCDQCLFTKNRIVSGKRMQQIVSSCLRDDKHFECHKGTINNDKIVCAGWYEQYTSQMIRIAGRLNSIQFVEL
jgi:hypothetical protein